MPSCLFGLFRWLRNPDNLDAAVIIYGELGAVIKPAELRSTSNGYKQRICS